MQMPPTIRIGQSLRQRQENKEKRELPSEWEALLFVSDDYLFFFASAIFIARTLSGRPNKVIKPSAS